MRDLRFMESRERIYVMKETSERKRDVSSVSDDHERQDILIEAVHDLIWNIPLYNMCAVYSTCFGSNNMIALSI